jgi:hypothetical protein
VLENSEFHVGVFRKTEAGSTVRRRAPWAALVGAGALLGCFEDPIEERCTLRVEPTGEVRVTVETVVNRPLGGNRQFDERLAALEEELFGGYGAWQARLDGIGGDRDGLSWERWEGHLVRFERWTQLPEPERQLAELFGDTPIDVRLLRGEAASELTFLAGPSDRANRREREEVERALSAWADDLAAHLAATAELWRYFEAHPDRAGDVGRAMFDDLLEDEDRGQVGLLPVEEELVRRSQEAQQRVVEIFDFPEEEAHTLQETSRRVFDPFPAAFAVELPEGSRLLEREGFELDEEGRLVVPRTSLWDAFESLEGRWVSPDPLVAQARHLLRDRDAPFPVEAFLDQEFRYAVATPRGTEVATLLRRALRPRQLYRAVWSTPAGVSAP